MRIGRRTRRTVLRAAVSAGGAALGALAARRGRAGIASAATAAAVAGAAQEWPPALAALPVGIAAASRDPVAGAMGAAVALATRKVWPVAPRHGAEVVRRRLPDPDARPSADGSGVRIVVNPASGPTYAEPPTDELAKLLPGATVVELRDGDTIEGALDRGADGVDVVAVGAAGGDGTLNAAAGVALRRRLPFVAVPSGTLNHLARDLGLDDMDDVAAAVRAGTVVHMDLGVVGDRHFLNTLSFGGYTEIVDARERLERRVGKWPALVLALATVLRRLEPLPVALDGRRRDVWLVFIGNCHYSPPGFGPSWREQLDDGLLDVRLVDGRRPFARLRLLVAVLTGTLTRCAPYEEWLCSRLEVRSMDGALRVAVDGETCDVGQHVVVEKRPRALIVAVPPA